MHARDNVKKHCFKSTPTLSKTISQILLSTKYGTNGFITLVTNISLTDPLKIKNVFKNIENFSWVRISSIKLKKIYCCRIVMKLKI